MSDYRDDDHAGPGYCPRCGRTLTGLTTDARGFCETHGWKWAEWSRPTTWEDCICVHGNAVTPGCPHCDKVPA